MSDSVVAIIHRCIIAPPASAPRDASRRWCTRQTAATQPEKPLAVTDVSDIFIYGNHSPTMFADFTHAKIKGKPAQAAINDDAWLKNEFLPRVGKRGAEIIAARGLSSAASAANALIDHVRDLNTPGAVHSVAVESDGFYGFAKGIWAGVPVKTTKPGEYQVLTDAQMDDFAKSKLAATKSSWANARP